MACIVFDLDGTLVDSSRDLLAAANARFEAAGFAPPLTPKDRLTALKGGRAMLSLGAKRLGTKDATSFAEENYAPFLEHYRAHICDHTALYPDAEDALHALKAEGFKLAICTNKPEELALLLLEQLGALALFDAIIGVKPDKPRKPDPAPLIEVIEKCGGRTDAAILIGDSIVDYQCARAAGVDILLMEIDDKVREAEAKGAPRISEFRALPGWLLDWKQNK